VPPGGTGQLFGNLVEGVVPGNRREGSAPDALVANPAQRLGQPVGVMLALGVAGYLGANDAPRINLGDGPANPPDTRSIDPLDLQSAGARTVMRADAGQDVERQSMLRRRFPSRI